MNKKHYYEAALQQITGFRHARYGYSFRSLIETMGLTEKEWGKIKKEESVLLEPQDIEDGDAYFDRSI